MPNGNTFIPKGRNVFIPNAPIGMKVLSAERTAQVMGKKSPTFNYAEGVGNVDIWNYESNPKGLINAVSNINYSGLKSIPLTKEATCCLDLIKWANIMR